MRVALIIFALLLSASGSKAQMAFQPTHASLYQIPLVDSSEKNRPRRATIMSAIIPGLGQLYNQKYWKVGLLYAAGFGMGYGMQYNLDSMRQYQKALNARIDGDTLTEDIWYPGLTDAKVTGERDYYRRNRDLLIIGFIGLYALQIIDANVDAHLKEFEVNKDLAMRITPDFRYTYQSVSPGLTVSLRLK